MNTYSNLISDCIICNGSTSFFGKQRDRVFRRCESCFTIFLNPAYFLSELEEQKHYECHVNDVKDKGYRDFTAPIWKEILKNHHKQEIGLDFGAGPGPVISEVLRENGFLIELYDPFFHPDEKVFTKKYDFIFASEVAEHFHDPLKEFMRLSNLLNPNGKLYVMTHLFEKNNRKEFENWYYIKDVTHVVIYHPNSFLEIAKSCGFSKFQIKDRLITLIK